MNNTASAPPPQMSSDGGDGFGHLGTLPQLVAALARMRVVEPTPVQRAAIPAGLEGRDMAIVAHTGTGKTLAYLVPLAQRLLQQPPARTRGRPVDPRRRMRALVVCPTRELAQQVAREAAQLFRGSVLRTGAVFGKSALPPQRDMVRKGVDLLVGTPGRLRELCDLDALTLAFAQQVVVDEADRMLDMGFLPQVRDLLSRTPNGRQLLFFTATMPPQVNTLVQEFLRDPVRTNLTGGAPVEVKGTPNPRTDAGQRLMRVEDDHKAALTVALVKDGHRRGVMVFCRTRRRAGWVAAALRRHEIRTALLHGDRSQKQRQAALDEFVAGEARVLVATDVAARGLHVPAARCVVNYDVPLLPEEYVHRVGRAGHGGGSAEAITLLCPADEERWGRVERAARAKLREEKPPAYTAYQRVRVGVAPDAERPKPVQQAARKAAERRAREAEREKARQTPSLAAIIKRGKKGTGKKRSQRQGMQRKRPLGKGQKPGKGAVSTRRAAGGPARG